MKTLIIAEKPSVAADIARILGKVKKNGDYYENDSLVIASALGHLVELFMPDDIDKKLKRWTLQNLPIMPDNFSLKPIEKTKSRFQELKKLMARKDVSQIVNACDAGREGELIFTYIYELAGCKKPCKRMWMMSMTPDAIREAFENLRDYEVMQPLQDAARCRSEADWLIGINGTRAVTSRMMGSRRGQAATVGRVQTPTLSLVVAREHEIRNFVPRDYWYIEGHFGVASGEYMGALQRKDYEKDPTNEHDRSDRFWEREEAERLLAEIQPGMKGEVSDETKRTRQSSPRLYDLTTLQREANKRFGYPANMTLRLAQALYEKHKMLTYPRTDSRALPEDYPATVRETLGVLDGDYTRHASKVLDNGWVNPKDRRVFNSKQVSDHFAIIPTNITGKKLSDEEANIYDMVARRFIAVFYPMAEFDETVRLTKVGELEFRTTGKVLVVPGWLDVYGKATHDKETIPAVGEADGSPPVANVIETTLFEDQTKPPPRYTEATLLSAMEGAGKLVDDEELAEAMKEKGLGTPATRAATIEHLLAERYMEREKRELSPTPKAENLMAFLSAVKIDDLTSPALTGDWEHQLHRMEQGAISREEFMKGIRQMTERVVNRTREFDESQVESHETDIPSPTDGKPLMENFRAYRSQDGEFAVYKTIGNRKMQAEEIRTLVREREVGPLDGFRSKAGKPYSAILRLNDENRVEFVFGNNGEGEGSEGEINLEEFPVIATDKSNVNIHETPNAYVWADGSTRISRNILSRTIPREQFLKLINEGKTDLLDKFKSKRTGRFFDAHLLLKAGNKIGFEFPPRAPKKKTARKATKKTAAKASSGEGEA